MLLVPALLYALAFLFMPFSVLGVKGRLDAIEARLDEIQGEIRSLALRLPESVHATDYDEIYAAEPAEPAQRPAPIGARGRRFRRPRTSWTRRAARAPRRTATATGRRAAFRARLDWPR